MMKAFKRPTSAKEAIEMSHRYFNNAKEILKNVEIKYGIYTDEKPVKEACAIGYLSALLAIDAFALSKGCPEDKLPTSYDEYWEWLKKAPHNGKLQASLRVVYENLHIFGYYRGGVGVEMIKEGFKHAKRIIDTFSKLFDRKKKREDYNP